MAAAARRFQDYFVAGETLNERLETSWQVQRLVNLESADVARCANFDMQMSWQAQCFGSLFQSVCNAL